MELDQIQPATECLNKIIELEKQKWKIIFELIPKIYTTKKLSHDIILDNILFGNICDLEVSPRTENCLYAESIALIGDIVCNPYLTTQNKPIVFGQSYRYFDRLLRIPNFGKKSYRDFMDQLNKKGIDCFIDYPSYLEEREKITGTKYEFTKI